MEAAAARSSRYDFDQAASFLVKRGGLGAVGERGGWGGGGCVQCGGCGENSGVFEAGVVVVGGRRGFHGGRSDGDEVILGLLKASLLESESERSWHLGEYHFCFYVTRLAGLSDGLTLQCLATGSVAVTASLGGMYRLSWVQMGRTLHGKVVRVGFESNTFVRNTLIHFHANCGELGVAKSLFDGCEERDVVAWSALTAGYARRGELAGEMGCARELFDEVPERDVVTWNAMIAGYVLCGGYQEAFEMFEEMRRAGERPDEVTMLSLLSACTDSGALDVGQRMHSSIMEISSGSFGILLGNALIDMYAKCGSIEKALEVFRGMREKDVSTWNSIVGGLAYHGHAKATIDMFVEMRRQKFRPNEITFVGVLVACSHAGMLADGHKYFDLMRNEYSIEPNIKHYGCMVDMLGRAGLLDEAFKFVETMEIEPNPIIWRTLLGACEWDGSQKVRKLMDDRMVRKEAGRSIIDANNKELMKFLFDSKQKLDARNIPS
ncbi:hypothetical protein Syun_023539 [Stephania yunnanensis]|uniref:Pentatricopeptide repeat-containing protein n=1 Tax=Stephania yunnanensis TaxID=152371 RepID=A0AAP0FN67_9MAGN